MEGQCCRKLWISWEKSRRKTKQLQEALKEQIEMTRELVKRQKATVQDMSREMVEIKK
ncbi:hypothetical protein FNYG_11619 [Fusarium nygamai]|uniref:Uncharacterized protein n=1 Tax=Gibberella nygamai TaxID=42673 RepID=A0A2K0VYI1_GIBNY|nr:hypothetical protein FNYG_11619 [Fusarium nygamai]